MFKVIRESTDIKGCKTIFLVDKSEFLTGSSKVDYIEKYISYTLDLCKVEYQEIVDYHINKIFDDEFTNGIKDILLKDRDVAAIKKLICRFPENILQRFEELLEKENEAHKKRNEKNTYQSQNADNLQEKEDEEYEKAKIDELNYTIQTINKNLANSRKVKNYLKGIKRSIDNLNVGIDECYQEFRQEDWIQAVIEVQFIKYVLPELYKDIKECNDLWEFGNKFRSHTFEITTGLKYGFLLSSEKKIMLLNEIIHNVDVIDFTKVMSEESKYLKELNSEIATIKHVKQYLAYSRNLEDLCKVLDLCLEAGFKNNTDQEEFVKDMMGIISKQSNLMKCNKREFLAFSSRLIEGFRQLNLSEKEIVICENKGRKIIRGVIRENAYLFKIILMVFFDTTLVRTRLQVFSITDINEFYKMLKMIDSKSVYKGLEDDKNKLLGIKMYFGNLLNELKTKKYEKLGINIKEMEGNLDVIFKICQVWNSVKSFLSNDDRENLAFNKYFEVDGIHLFKKTVFEDVTSLKLALEQLEEFYDKNTDSYETEYSLILLGMTDRMVVLSEKESLWFGDKKKEIADLLIRVAERCYKLDGLKDDLDKEIIDEIKVLVFRFCMYAQSDESTEKVVSSSD